MTLPSPQRKLFWHLFAHSTALGFCLLISFDEHYDETEIVQTCFVRDDLLKVVIAAPLMSFSVLNLGLLFYAWRLSIDSRVRHQCRQVPHTHLRSGI